MVQHVRGWSIFRQNHPLLPHQGVWQRGTEPKKVNSHHHHRDRHRRRLDHASVSVSAPVQSQAFLSAPPVFCGLLSGSINHACSKFSVSCFHHVRSITQRPRVVLVLREGVYLLSFVCASLFAQDGCPLRFNVSLWLQRVFFLGARPGVKHASNTHFRYNIF